MDNNNLTVKQAYDLLDNCWIHVGDVNDDGVPVTSEGIVIHKFRVNHHTNEYYVIQVLNAFHMHPEVRDYTLMSDSPDKPIQIYQQSDVNIADL